MSGILFFIFASCHPLNVLFRVSIWFSATYTITLLSLYYTGISKLITYRKLAERLGSFTGLSTVPRSVPAVFSLWLWYDPSRNMGAPPGTHSINPLPTALYHVEGLPAGLSFSLGKHLMKIFFPSRTFLYCLNVVISPPSVICSKLSMICVHLQIHSSLIPVLISGTSTPVPWIPLLPSDLVPEIILSIYPYALELPPWGNCPVQVFVILQEGCSFPSCVIIVCLILFCLV